MVDLDHFRTLALSLPGAEEKLHFEKPSFRYKDKIFATYHANDNRAMLKLSPIEQSVYVSYNSAIFFAVPGAWGAKGYTLVVLSKVRKDIFEEALRAAYSGVVNKPQKKSK